MAKLTVGLTGGIGAGKSAVAEFFAQRGATVIDADEIAREVVAPGTEGLREISERWPQAIGEDGALDRAALARIVFSDAGARGQLNAITHPRVRERAAELAAAAPDGIVVQAIPLLFEGDAWREFDETVVVVAPLEERIARVMARDGTDRAAVERRIAAQIDPEEAQRLADYVIENDGDFETLRERTNRLIDLLERDLRDRVGAPSVLVRPMRKDDLEAVDAVVVGAYGFEASARPRLEGHLAQRKSRSFLAEIEGKAAGIVFGNDFGPSAYVSLMAVAPEYQRRGVARALMRALTTWSDRRGYRDVRLDATPAAAPLYEVFGFADAGTTFVYERAPYEHRPPESDEEESFVRPTRRGDLVTIFALDAEALGADRAPLVQRFVTTFDTFIARDGSGYLVVQRSERGTSLGPWIARDETTAGALLDAALALCANVPGLVRVYPTAENPAALRVVEERGFLQARALRHMVRGSAVPPSALLFGRANLGQG